jgi:hypothetical protein
MGSLVLVGRCYLCGDLRWTKTRNAVCPIATVVLDFDASQFSLPHATIKIFVLALSPLPILYVYAAGATVWMLFRSGS